MEVDNEYNNQYNLCKTCRACLNMHGAMVDILRPGEREENLLRIYTGIVNSVVVKNEYPFLICLLCEEKLLQNHSVQIQSGKSNAVIEQYLIQKAIVIIKEESNIVYESEDDSKHGNDVINSDVDMKEYIESNGQSKLKQFTKNEVIEAIEDLKKLSPCPQDFKCTLCPFEGKGISRHMLLIHSEHKWCSICNELYEDLSIHSRQCHSSKKFKCKFCDRDFKSKYKLIVHLKFHGGIKPHKCTKCDMEFVTLDQLRRHHRVHDVKKSHESYHCEICNRCFAKLRYFKLHLASHNPDQIKLFREGKLTAGKPFICSLCNKGFTRNTTLNAHMGIHAGTQGDTRETDLLCIKQPAQIASKLNVASAEFLQEQSSSTADISELDGTICRKMEEDQIIRNLRLLTNEEFYRKISLLREVLKTVMEPCAGKGK